MLAQLLVLKTFNKKENTEGRAWGFIFLVHSRCKQRLVLAFMSEWFEVLLQQS